MSEEEIVKALECCSVQDKNLCRVCPLSELQGECVEMLAKQALDLINTKNIEFEKAIKTIDGLIAGQKKLIGEETK